MFSKRISLLVFVLTVALVGVLLYRMTGNEQVKSALDSQIRTIVDSEEQILALTPELSKLSGNVLNLRIPDETTIGLFAPIVVKNSALQLDSLDSSGERSFGWSVKKSRQEFSRDAMSIWKSFFEKVHHFESAKFYFVSAKFDDEMSNLFHGIVGFDGLAIYNNGRITALDAKLKVDWIREEETGQWQIARWQTDSFHAMESNEKLFKDVLQFAIQDRKVHFAATNSEHNRITSTMIRGGDYFLPEGVTYPFFFPDVTLEHPGVSVVDLDHDGFDDLYIAMQHGKNLFFKNNGDGTFDEQAETLGIDVTGDSTCSIFADFDNDGDDDLVVGRARQKALFFINEAGRFRKLKRRFGQELPALVSSISAADYNSDGLLDLYFCTYSPIEPNGFQSSEVPLWASHFLSDDQQATYLKHFKRSHKFLSFPGPPNALFENVGDGRFELSKHNKDLELWGMSFQASWHDFDNDGDSDVYVANDYGPDRFMRNDGDNGFSDVTEQTGLTQMGFGMGITWGDYDNDGRTDAYVSNMFSKAGRRITDQVENIDSRLVEMAQGNFLYRRNDSGFELVSGHEKNQVKVAKAGWSWGGQFIDVNNDGFRDLYVVNGYYTAPKDVAVNFDL